MQKIRTTLIATALLTGLTGLALAQSNPSPSANTGAERMEKMHEHRAERHSRHLNELKSKLNVQGTQEAAWNSFAQSMQAPTHRGQPERASFEKMTTPERLDQMQAMKAARDARMQKRVEATKAFYASLNPDQKQVFDQETARMMKGPGMHAMKHPGGHS
jgi:periplasmic protein CpxP/Spy